MTNHPPAFEFADPLHLEIFILSMICLFIILIGLLIDNFTTWYYDRKITRYKEFLDLWDKPHSK